MRRLLVVDDALFMRKMICGVAAEAGWEVVGEAGERRGGGRALRPAPARPGDDGPGDARDGRPRGPAADPRSSTRRPGSSWSPRSTRSRPSMDSIRDGAIDFIVKPFERERVLNLLAKLGGSGGASVDGSWHERPTAGSMAADDSASSRDRRGPSWRTPTESAVRIARPGAGPDRGRLGPDAQAADRPARLVAGDRGRGHGARRPRGGRSRRPGSSRT